MDRFGGNVTVLAVVLALYGGLVSRVAWSVMWSLVVDDAVVAVTGHGHSRPW